MINLFHAIKILQNKNYNNLNFSFLGSGIDLNLCKKFVNDHKLSNIKFLKPILKKNVFKEISKYASGFLYYVSLKGVTGQQHQMYQTACQQWTTAITMEANYKKNCEYVQKGQSLVKITERIRVAEQQMELLSTKVLELQTKHDKVRSAHAAWAQTTQLCQELKLSYIHRN